LPEDVPSDYASAITALMADGGRDTPASTVRSTSPALAAGQALASMLGLPAAAVTAGTAPAGAAVLGAVESATYGDLVRQMLQDSDNVIAEVLGRQVALASHQPATFVGAAAAIHATLAGLGVDDGGAMLDASGLSPGDRLAPTTLTAVLRLAGAADRPDLGWVAASLPVAGWSGTLANRYLSGAARVGAGDVRAKTGTLTGVSTLAGLVTTKSGRLLAFSLVADQVAPGEGATEAAEAALDAVAAAMAGCDCG
jgi:D-alanyl-D-alanine carboxypeptidase/D-alanyl-D-alanine-endopeptidase (penicillin-binding protein 4)